APRNTEKFARWLLAFVGAGQAKAYSAVVVDFGGSGKIEIGKRNLLGVLRRKIPQCLSYDGVILDFLFVLIAEDQHGGGSGLCAFRLVLRRRAARVNILIALLTHSLLIQ